MAALVTLALRSYLGALALDPLVRSVHLAPRYFVRGVS